MTSAYPLDWPDGWPRTLVKKTQGSVTVTIFITEAPDGTVVISHQAPKEADDTLAGLLAVQLLNGAKQILDTICDQETQVQKVS